RSFAQPTQLLIIAGWAKRSVPIMDAAFLRPTYTTINHRRVGKAQRAHHGYGTPPCSAIDN
ncbi:MAG: hypothetical protein WBN51_02490, partial [Gammaproteobacteria bacterium]